jgi:hypothetical protein
VTQLGRDLQDRDYPIEARSPGIRTARITPSQKWVHGDSQRHNVAAVGVWVRIWIAIVATLALGVGAFISVAAVGQIHHENGCSQYHDALVAISGDVKLAQKPDAADLNVLAPNVRHQVTQGMRAVEQAIKKHQNEAALDRAVLAIYLSSSLVPSAMAEHGC